MASHLVSAVPPVTWRVGRFQLDVSRPRVMGIVNLTPDSFSDGGRYNRPALAIAHAEKLLKEGADILDLGAESTRPGAPKVPLAEELHRLRPVLAELLTWNVPISIDTYKPEVMQAVLESGCDIINDIWALRHPPMELAAGTAESVIAAHPSCGICLMHMHRDPQTMQVTPMEVNNVVDDVCLFLKQRIEALKALKVDLNRISVDPGIGFGKTPQQNLALLAKQSELVALGCTVLAGWSRKSTLGWVLGDGGSNASKDAVLHGRQHASVAAAVLAVDRGARVVRVHDVKETVQALAVWSALQGC